MQGFGLRSSLVSARSWNQLFRATHSLAFGVCQVAAIPIVIFQFKISVGKQIALKLYFFLINIMTPGSQAFPEKNVFLMLECLQGNRYLFICRGNGYLTILMSYQSAISVIDGDSLYSVAKLTFHSISIHVCSHFCLISSDTSTTNLCSNSALTMLQLNRYSVKYKQCNHDSDAHVKALMAFLCSRKMGFCCLPVQNEV